MSAQCLVHQSLVLEVSVLNPPDATVGIILINNVNMQTARLCQCASESN